MKFLITLAITLAAMNGGYAQLIETRELSLEAANKIMTACLQFAREQKAPGGAVAVVDAGGHLICLARLDHTFPAASEVAIHKANTAACFRAPSAKLENAINGGRQALITVGHTFLQGGIPIVINGQVVGAVGVSGSASAQQDEDIAMAALKVSLQ